MFTHLKGSNKGVYIYRKDIKINNAIITDILVQVMQRLIVISYYLGLVILGVLVMEFMLTYP